MESQDTVLTGAVLDGKYRVTHLVGQGGMGAVYQAEHVGTGRPVAVKVLLSELVRNTEAVERFRREARAAGRLRHPNVVDVTDFGVARVGQREIAYLVMEYLEGSSLRAALDARGALPLDVVVDIVEQIAAALESAHAADVVHRDLKPDNVWLVHDGRGGFAVRVLDFGIARLGQEARPARSNIESATYATDAASVTAERTAVRDVNPDANQIATVMTPRSREDDVTAARLTTAGSLVGTPLYMSPEQCRGMDVDARTDIYSLGVLTYEALAGRRPFQGGVREVIESHLNAPPPALEGVTPAVAAVVMRAMAKSPGDRYGSARALAGSLRVAAEGPGVIMRRSIALYAERFHEFFRISSGLSRLPALVVAVLLGMSLLLALLSPDKRLRLAPLLIGAALAPVLWGLVTAMTNAAFAAAIERLRMRPLERVEAGELLADIQDRLGVPRSFGHFRTTCHLMVYYIRCELGAAAGSGDLAFLIGFLERVPLAEIRPRCALLAAGSRRAYTRVRAALFVTLFALPLLETGVLALALRPIGEKAVAVAAMIAITLVPLNAIAVNPVFSSALALVYFRARQANGEDVPLAAVLPGRL